MSLILFSMVLLSTVYALIFFFWWHSSAPLTVHLSVLATVLIAALSILIVVSIYPHIQRQQRKQSPSKMDKLTWGQDISNKLSSPAAVIEGFNIKFANNAFLKEFGLIGMEEFITDMPITNLLHPSNHNEFTKFISHQEDDNINRTLSLRMMYVDGTTIPVHMSLSPLNQEETGNIWLLQFSLTSPSRTDTNSQVEVLQYQLLLDRIEQIVFQINVNHEIIFANPAWERLLDYTSDETIDRDLFGFIHPEDLLLAEARLNALIEGKRQHTQLELRLIAKNGVSRWFELRASTTSMLKGERSSVIGTLTDISQMKQASAGLRANSGSATEMIMSRIPAMIYRCKNDRHWSLEYVSNGCLEVSEYQPYELVRTPSIPYMSLIHPDDQQTCWEFVQKQIAKQQSFHMIYRLITRSGKTKWVFEQGRGVFSGSDELLSLEGIITDLHCDNYDCLKNGLSGLLTDQTT